MSLACAERLLDIEIDRHVVLEVQQIGEAQVGFAQRISGAGEACEFAIGGGEEDDCGGRLVEIDSLGSAVDHPGGGGEEVHQPRNAASMAGRSIVFSPITTSWLRRGSPSFHGRSK